MRNKKMLRECQSELILITACISYLIVRFYLATLSSYPIHGWNEGHYSLIAKGYFDHSLLIQERGGSINWAVPPFYSWIVFAFFKLFGISDINARLTSIFAAIFAVFFVYLLAKELFDPNVAILSSLFFLVIPWVVRLSGKAQTDMVMTAFMTASIACFVYAYNHKKSFIPFGIFFGLALFTKQPSILILAIVGVWVIFVKDVRLEVLKRSVIPVLIGFIPILVYLIYHIVNGGTSGIAQLVYGVALHRTSLFSNWNNTLGGLLVGISPLVLLFTLYELYKSRDLRTILVIWLVAYGAFVLARTPPSHEYYILPLAVPFAILASKGVFSFKDAFALEQKSRKKIGTIVAIVVIFSTMPVSFVFLSYHGDLGYTCTKDVVDYLAGTDHGDEILILTPDRYDPQLRWYSELNGLKAEVGELPNDLSLVSLADLRDLSSSTEASKVFLIIDGRGGLEERLEDGGYERVYSSYYWTKLPSAPFEIYTGEKSESEYFEQHLSVYKLNYEELLRRGLMEK